VKRFKWPLQRLLDVTAQRERTLRRELLELTREMARLRREIVSRKVALEEALGELGKDGILQRISKQELFMRCCEVKQNEIRRIEEDVKALSARRSEKRNQFLRTRASRQTLERLREEARERHMREQLKLEQKELDEGAHISFARKILKSRAVNVT
jgi:flagellar export protein FliJ